MSSNVQSHTVSDRWFCFFRDRGFKVGSPHVGASRVEFIGTQAQWDAAHVDLMALLDSAKGAEIRSIKAAAGRIMTSEKRARIAREHAEKKAARAARRAARNA